MRFKATPQIQTNKEEMFPDRFRQIFQGAPIVKGNPFPHKIYKCMPITEATCFGRSPSITAMTYNDCEALPIGYLFNPMPLLCVPLTKRKKSVLVDHAVCSVSDVNRPGPLCALGGSASCRGEHLATSARLEVSSTSSYQSSVE